MMINKLRLQSFYESHKDDYYRRRNSGDAQLWDEAYKWDVFPKLNCELSKYKTVTADNLSEIVNILKKHNPQKGSFAHWTEVDNLSILTRHTNGWQVIAPLWNSTPDTVEGDIETIDTTGDFLIQHKFGNAMYGFMLAARDCGSFTIYHTDLVKRIVEEGVIDKPKSKAESYATLNEVAQFIGELMQADQLTNGLEYKALNGQDFLWVSLIKYS